MLQAHTSEEDPSGTLTFMSIQLVQFVVLAAVFKEQYTPFGLLDFTLLRGPSLQE